MKFKNLILVLLIASSQLMISQNADNKIAITLYGGINQYNGDLGNGLKNFEKLNPLGALSLTTYLTRSFDLGLQGSYGKYGYNGSYTLPNTTTVQNVDFFGNKMEGFLHLDYKLANGYLFGENSFIQPFLTAGVGLASYQGANLYEYPIDLITPLGGGLKFKFSNRFAVTYKFLYAFTTHDDHDMARSNAKYDFLNSKNDAFAEHLLGVSFSFGKPKDSDKDGIPDKKDKCPDTPRGVQVDENGCPTDRDADGIADYVDKCPDVFGIEQFEGCPDTDGDGVEDSKDKCPDTPKGIKVDAQGCPIDTDKDGIVDYLDKCPNVYGVAAFEGCPDTDGDGIQDSLDKCPEIPGLPEYDGCPKPEEIVVPVVESIDNVLFETDKSIIRPQYIPALDKAVKFLKENPTAKAIISGHTDNQYTETYNITLSLKRADVVKQYLVNNGVNPANITTEYFGKTKPVADNSTETGRSLNRRTEIKIVL